MLIRLNFHPVASFLPLTPSPVPPPSLSSDLGSTEADRELLGAEDEPLTTPANPLQDLITATSKPAELDLLTSYGGPSSLPTDLSHAGVESPSGGGGFQSLPTLGGKQGIVLHASLS